MSENLYGIMAEFREPEQLHHHQGPSAALSESLQLRVAGIDGHGDIL